MPNPDPVTPPALHQAMEEFLKAQSVPVGRPAGTRAPAAPSSRPSSTAPARDILSAYEEVLEHERQKQSLVEERRSLWKPVLQWSAVAVLTGASLWVWLGHPAFLQPTVQAPPAPVTAVMAQRQVLAFALQIEDFRVTEGHLPARLEELGIAVPPSLSYLPLPDGQFEIRIGQGSHTRVLRGGAGGEPRFVLGAR